MKTILSFLPRLWTNWITLTGTMITTVSGCTIVLMIAAEAVNPSPNPYTSAVAFLIMPMAFIGGLVLIPLGFWWSRFKAKRRGKPAELDPIQQAFQKALQDKSARRRIFFVGFLTMMNLVIVGAAGHQAVSFMDSVEFCGTMCHTVMQPEYEAYIRSPHSRVKCVKCHIGSGASWAVKAKISGLRQVWAVMVDSYDRPVHAPIKNLRPARDTCEQCHWPAKFHGNRVAFYSHYGQDELNTPEVTAVLLKVGGENPKTGQYHGIHWHVSPDIQVEFEVHDDKREQIGKVTWSKGGEQQAIYMPEKPGGEVKETRLMDCVDCHNRPTHIYDPSPQAAVDRVFASGKLDVAIPFLRKIAVKVISRTDIPRDQTEAQLLADMKAAYAKNHPDAKYTAEQLEVAAKVLAEVYKQNIFPEMKVAWDTYPSHLGHRGEEIDTRGCFRCHDNKHKREDGETLSQDCDLCHEILHEDEPLDELPDSIRALLDIQKGHEKSPKPAKADDEEKADDGDEAKDEAKQDAKDEDKKNVDKDAKNDSPSE